MGVVSPTSAPKLFTCTLARCARTHDICSGTPARPSCLLCRRFDGFRWAPHTEYLLLRNAYPSEARLAGALVHDASCSALCCQCSWLSVVERQRVGLGGSGAGAACRWVCAGH
jgi:hypothetical protein